MEDGYFEAFSEAVVDTGDAHIYVRHAEEGPALVLLHGFPETHLMWHRIAPTLARDFTVIVADLSGYGASSAPRTTSDHAPYSKRSMAQDVVAVMRHFGFDRFGLVGHDRGGRVAYRLALDHPHAVTRLAVLDIVPTVEVWQRADMEFALAFWPWSLLAQPAPFPERLMTAAAAILLDHILEEWSATPDDARVVFPDFVREAYRRALEDSVTAHAICEDYRASATIDITHDEDDRASGRRIRCPVLALWSEKGPLGTYDPLAVWHTWAEDVRGRAIASGHFLPEEAPEATLGELREFFDR